MNIDLSKASGPDCILEVAVLKKCEPELSQILAELFNKCFKALEYLQKTKTLKMTFILGQSFGIGLK